MPASPLADLTPEELRRYSRQLILPELGAEGQARLKSASVLIVGAGGLGSPLALYLAAAGIGRLGLVDFDAVDASNLHRQVLHHTPDVGRPKLESAGERLRALNPNVQLDLYPERLTSQNARRILRGYDAVADGADNFPTRYLVNDACVLMGIPNVHASVFRFEGQVTIFGAADGPCYRCLYPEPPPPGLVPSCAEGGVLGVVPGTVGTLQATEVLKLILGLGQSLVGRLLLFDALATRFETVSIPRDPDCPVCGVAASPELIDYDAFCGAPAQVPELTAKELHARLAELSGPTLLDVRQPEEAAIASLGGHLIPLAELEGRLSELDRDAELVVYCRTGARSAQAVRILQAHGFRRAVNLAGGLHAWSAEVDPSIPAY